MADYPYCLIKVGGIFEVLIDLSDCVPAIVNYLTVSTHASGYLAVQLTSGEGKGKTLANALLSPPKGLVVDHINGNTLDNRRANLRVVTRSQNMANAPVSSTKKSKLPKGVFFRPNRGHYYAVIRTLGSAIHLGSYHTAEEAKAVYDRYAEALHGEYAVHKSRSSQ